MMRLAWLLLLAGCAAAPAPPDLFYRIDAGAPGTLPKLADTPIRVGRMAGSGILNERAVMLSRAEQPLQLERHPRAFWTLAPPELIADALVSWLERGGAAPQIHGERSPAPVEHEIRGRVLRFEQALSRENPTVHLELELMFLSRGELVHLGRYTVQQSATGPSTNAAAEALGQAAAQAFGLFVADLSAAAKR